MVTPEERLRQDRARWRQACGLEEPTLGWLFPDTPKAPSPDDGRVPRAVPLEEWAAQQWPPEPLEE